MTITDPTRAPVVGELISSLLDRGYQQAAGAALEAIVRTSTSGLMARRYAELEAEAARLAALGQKLDPDNAVYRAFLADLTDTLRADAALVDSASEAVQLSGIDAAGPTMRQLALPGFTDALAAQIGVVWNVPNPDAVAATVRYAGSDAWGAAMVRYGAATPEVAQNVIVRGMVEGWGPVRTARELRRVAESLPVAHASTALRTLQLTSWRDGQALHQVANADILDYQVRVAVLDARTCIACILQHGDILPLGERVDDHHAGRCVGVPHIRGRDPLAVEAGEDWLARQTPETQQQYMGGAFYRAWQDGAVQLRDVIRPYEDDVFGRMVGEASLKGILGEAAQRYYAR